MVNDTKMAVPPPFQAARLPDDNDIRLALGALTHRAKAIEEKQDAILARLDALSPAFETAAKLKVYADRLLDELPEQLERLVEAVNNHPMLGAFVGPLFEQAVDGMLKKHEDRRRAALAITAPDTVPRLAV